MTDRETLGIYNARAEEYAARFDTESTPDTQLTAFLADLAPGAYILDLGCGPGRSAAMMAAAGHSVLAVDASPGMVALAARHPGVMAREETFDDLDGTAIYDAVWANFSLLHALPEDLPRHIGAIAQALRPGGLFHVGMKLGEGVGRDSLGRRYTYVTDASLRALLIGASLTPIRDWTGRGPGLAGDVEPWIVLQARKDA